MTTYLSDGTRFEVEGVTFEAIADRESNYAGFECLTCGDSFTHDPSDHRCDEPERPEPMDMSGSTRGAVR